MKKIKIVRSKEDLTKLVEGDFVKTMDGDFMVCGSWEDGKKLYGIAVDGIIIPYDFNEVIPENNGRVTPLHDFSIIGLDEGSKEYRWVQHLFSRMQNPEVMRSIR